MDKKYDKLFPNLTLKGKQIGKLLLTLLVGIILGWFLRHYSSESRPSVSTPTISEVPTEKPETKPEPPLQKEAGRTPSGVKNHIIQGKAVTAQPPVSEVPPADQALSDFGELLKKRLFDDAMERYMDADEEDIGLYRKLLMQYFDSRAKASPEQYLKEIEQFMEIDPEYREANDHLISFYLRQKRFLDAIAQIERAKEWGADESETQKLDALLKTSADAYVDRLKKEKDDGRLLSFLERMTEYDRFGGYYTMALAQQYFDLQQYDKSRTLLETLQNDTVYGSQAGKLLDKIIQSEARAREYEYAIPLHRRGDHFSVEVVIDSATTLTLLIDTGATYTHIAEGKLFSPFVIRGGVRLHTAGGEITADLCRVGSFTVGEIELQNFDVMVSPFEQKGIDGLLGMNFFKRFKFFVDQKEAVLRLSRKK